MQYIRKLRLNLLPAKCDVCQHGTLKHDQLNTATALRIATNILTVLYHAFAKFWPLERRAAQLQQLNR
jgi:hypothetical protein